jgi:hypothetical protein
MLVNVNREQETKASDQPAPEKRNVKRLRIIQDTTERLSAVLARVQCVKAKRQRMKGK